MSDKKTLQEKLLEALAISLRCDGSVDRTQLDKIYLMAKLVFPTGMAENVFLWAAEPLTNGAKDVHDAILTAYARTVRLGSDDDLSMQEAKKLFCRASSLVTDGASVNVGQRNGPWALLEKDRENTELNENQPAQCMKIKCAAHRAQLAWKALINSITEVDHMIQRLCSLSTFFRSFAVSTRNLYEIAKNENTAVLAFPSVFEIRWAEFTSSLIKTTLVSWKALVMYLKDKEGFKEKRFFNFLTSHSHLDLLSYLADVITIFCRFQRKLQSDSKTLLDMGDHVKTVKDQLKKLKQDPLLGRWMETFNEQLVVQSDGDDENMVLSGRELRTAKPRRKQHHNLFLSKTRDVTAVKNEIVDSLINFSDERFSISDYNDISILKPFVDQENSADIKLIHNTFFKDLPLEELGMKYAEAVYLQDIDQLKCMLLQYKLKRLMQSGFFPNVSVAFARIFAAKSHSA